jgi:hypothetical protein
MAKYLTIVTETYRVDSEDEASRLIEEAKKSNQYTLAKYSSVYKERKQKGEVIDAWYRLTLTKVFDDEKEPMNNVEVIYDTEGSAF